MAFAASLLLLAFAAIYTPSNAQGGNGSTAFGYRFENKRFDISLIEIDLKRPGRVDVKVPLMPTATTAESAGLIAALAKRYGLPLEAADLGRLEPKMPTLLTPGAAEALVVKAYRHSRTQNVSAAAALEACLVGYQNPVPADVLEFQMRIAAREATDLAFVPEPFRKFAAASPAA